MSESLINDFYLNRLTFRKITYYESVVYSELIERLIVMWQELDNGNQILRSFLYIQHTFLGYRIMIKTPSYVEENVFPDKNGRNPLSSMIYRFFFSQRHCWLEKMFWALL